MIRKPKVGPNRGAGDPPTCRDSPCPDFNKNDPELLERLVAFDKLTHQVDIVQSSCEKTEMFNQKIDHRLASLETMVAKLTLKLDDAASRVGGSSSCDSFKTKNALQELHESVESFEDMGQMLEENQNLDQMVERVRREQLVQHHKNRQRAAAKKRHPLLACFTCELVFDPLGQGRQLWEVAMAALLLYNTAEMPLQVAFEEDMATEWKYLNVLIDVLFIIDIGVNFRTGFYAEGTLVRDWRDIAKHYAVAHTSDGDALAPRNRRDSLLSARPTRPTRGSPHLRSLLARPQGCTYPQSSRARALGPPSSPSSDGACVCSAQATATRWRAGC